MPLSVRLTVSKDIPTSESTHESCADWLKQYNNHIYNNSVFFKGPLMYATTILDEKFSVASIGAFKLYKKNLKKTLT